MTSEQENNAAVELAVSFVGAMLSGVASFGVAMVLELSWQKCIGIPVVVTPVVFIVLCVAFAAGSP